MSDWLRSWSCSLWFRALRRAACWQLVAWSLLRILCLPCSLPLPTLCSVSVSTLKKNFFFKSMTVVCFLLSVFVVLGSHNKISYTEWLKQQKCISSQLGRLKVLMPTWLDSGGSLSGLQMAAFLLYPQMVFPRGVCVCVQRALFFLLRPSMSLD